MPRRKANSKAKTKARAQCLTLDEDETTRCTEPPTHGHKLLERCVVHQAQCDKMYRRYKDASKVVDEILEGSIIPSEAEISGYTDLRLAVDKARWMRRYVEAIRVEKTGREIHQKRFFLKVDDGHKIRVKVLAKQMIAAVEVLDAIQARAYELHLKCHPAQAWYKDMQTAPPTEPIDADVTPKEDVCEDADPQDVKSTGQSKPPVSKGTEDDDLIEMKLAAEKARLLRTFEPILKSEGHVGMEPSQDFDMVRMKNIKNNIVLQYVRRIIFYDSVLFFKALDKVSFKDLLLDVEFSQEDAARIDTLWQQRLGFGLLWMKDATMEAIAMSEPSLAGQFKNAANVGDFKDRASIVGGWIYFRRHKQRMSNEAWWCLINVLNPPANVENRFVRLCNNFDDLHAFLSFVALGLTEPPSFCAKPDKQGRNSIAQRHHLSLCGVAVTDMISPIPMLGPLPSQHPAIARGCITWAEMESRAYMFGAIRHEPDQFAKAFLDELRAHPEHFLLVTRSDTDPGRNIETFGVSSNETIWQVRARMFEAPLASRNNRPHGRGEWSVKRSVMDILYGTNPIKGYLTEVERYASGPFFRHKKFDVKYFVILDTTPNRNVRHLTRLVAWAAFRAHKLVEGEHEPKAYKKASDALYERNSSERLAWKPKSWHAKMMSVGIDSLS